MELPEDIIHIILSFLQEKEGSKAIARASVLSKSWLSAWRTRPNLCFCKIDYKNKNHFFKHVNTTMLRYQDETIRIQVFHLWTPFSGLSSQLLNRWLQIAVERGVDKFILWGSFDFSSTILQAKSLQHLEIRWLHMNLKRSGFMKLHVPQNISCHNLKRVYLSNIHLEDAVFNNLVSNCPLIESLELLHCNGLENLQVTSLEYLRELSVNQLYSLRRIEIWSRTLETLVVDQFKVKDARIDNFTYEGGTNIPRLSFKGRSRPKTCEIRFTNYKCIDAAWLLKLKVFLGQLIQSKIFLSILSRGTIILTEEEIRLRLAFLQPHLQQLNMSGF